MGDPARRGGTCERLAAGPLSLFSSEEDTLTEPENQRTDASGRVLYPWEIDPADREDPGEPQAEEDAGESPGPDDAT